MDKHKHSRREHKSKYRSFSSSDEDSNGRSKSKRKKSNESDNQEFRQGDKCSPNHRINKNEFSFENFKHVLNKAFLRDTGFVDDTEDFWLFVKKYESVQRKAKESKNFDKSLLINITLNCNVDDIYHSKLFPDDRYNLPRHHLEDFKNIILLYIDFKQKEKYVKLKKLRRFQNDLPVAQFKDDIVEAVRRERVLIIAGDTGCGKSTQVPQYLVKAGYSKIACTQPRRIACISLSKRVSYETLSEFKSDIGYQIRFEKSRNQETKVIFITEGLLLRQLSGEDALPDYEVIVLDEVHERHLYGDFLLGVVKCLLFQLPNLKIILMSATININLFSNFFGDVAKVIQVPGRLHPIKLHYKPITVEEKAHLSKSERLNPGPYIQIMQLIDSKYPKSERGDLLIFLSGMSEITSVIDAAQQYNEKAASWIILPLHSSLSLAEQDKVFSYPPEGMRKCIVSTNIAETSITIDGIRFVIDSGKVKEMSYDPVSKMQRLKEFTVSRASAEQRKGRAGRTGPGVCYRLYSEEDYNEMSDYTTPELQRVPLDSLLLQMIAMGLPDARKFPFIEPPPPESIETSILSLKQHSALTEDEKITVLGQMLSKLPVDIPLGKMLITATMFHQLETVISLAATLSVQTPFTNRAYRDPECETSRKELESDHGDPITFLNAFREWLEVKSKANNARVSFSSRQWCKRRGLEEQRFYEMTKLRSQFKDLLKDCGLLELGEQAGSSSKEGMSSNERSLRHGEVKLLKAMKRTYQQSNPSRPKVLKPDSYQLVSPDNENEIGDDQIDIRDVDFRLSHDSSKVQNLVSGSTACSYRDVTMLKVILCSGLYPQVAIPDEFNHCKGVSDQLYHTRDKPFVWLHPMSFFGNNPQVLQLQESDIIQAPSGFSSKNPLSNKHQILFYMSLLETTKPYLVNTLRMPAAQTLLLFAREIHTNSTFTKIICDSWLELNFLSSEESESLILKVVRLRSLWNELLKLKLEEKDCTKSERILTDGLLQLMNGHIIYSLKRLLTADIKILYYGGSLCFDDSEDEFSNQVNPIDPEYRITKNSKIGGLQLAPYLVYNCLIDDDNAFESWQCPHCEMVAALSALERLQHLHICQPKEQNEDDVRENIKKKPNSRPYDCPECKKQYFFTPTDILKHRKSHQH